MGDSLKKAYINSLTKGIKLKDKGPKNSELTPEFIQKYEEVQEALREYYKENPDEFRKLN
jgi:hypothetical protein